MKRITNIIGLCFVSLLVLASCSNEVYNKEDGKSLMKFASRAATDAAPGDGFFTSGDHVGVYAVSGNELSDFSLIGERYMNNVNFVCTGKYFEGIGPCYYPGDGKVSMFYVYYPYVEQKIEPGSTSLNFSVQSRQNEEQNYKSSQFMLAKSAPTGVSNDVVALNFVPVLTKVDVVLVAGNGYAGIDDVFALSPEIEIKGCNVTGEINAETGEMVQLGAIGDIVMRKNIRKSNDSIKGYSAILMPQTVIAYTKFMEIKVGDMTYEFRPDSDMHLEAGKRYTVTVRLNKNMALADFGFTMQDWVFAGNIEIEADVDDKPANILRDIDGNVYNIVKIGEQYWMSSNLRVKHYNDGKPIL